MNIKKIEAGYVSPSKMREKRLTGYLADLSLNIKKRGKGEIELMERIELLESIIIDLLESRTK